jgi:toxin YoeB
MDVILSDEAKFELKEFTETGNERLVRKISQLVENIAETPKTGIGKPEQLKHKLAGHWSRRIDREHRLVYKINEDEKIVEVVSVKGHYVNRRSKSQ